MHNDCESVSTRDSSSHRILGSRYASSGALAPSLFGNILVLSDTLLGLAPLPHGTCVGLPVGSGTSSLGLSSWLTLPDWGVLVRITSSSACRGMILALPYLTQIGGGTVFSEKPSASTASRS